MIIPNLTPRPPRRYATDLTDAEWALIKPVIDTPQTGRGRRRIVDLRAVANGLLYKLRTGCQWLLLPRDFPPPSTVSYYFQKWRKNGRLQHLNDRLRRATRPQHARDPEPSAGIMDSQSAKSAPGVALRIGYDGGKKVKGRKRHLLVDTEGFLIDAVVTAANVSDQAGAKQLCAVAQSRCPRLAHLCADSAYGGTLLEWVQTTCGWTLEIVKKLTDASGFHVQPRRWVVERSIAWLTRNRQLSKEYDHDPGSSEGWLYLASIRVLLGRLTNPNTSEKAVT
jgi:putative transposase